MLCAEICTSCADACIAEEMDVAQCIRSCLDCADVCAATGRLAIRRTARNVETLRLMLETCSRYASCAQMSAPAMSMSIAGAAPRCAVSARLPVAGQVKPFSSGLRTERDNIRRSVVENEAPGPPPGVRTPARLGESRAPAPRSISGWHNGADNARSGRSPTRRAAQGRRQESGSCRSARRTGRVAGQQA